jgi:methionine-rich copper-binding protein CopC
MKLSFGALILIIATLGAGMAYAHPELQSTEPAAGKASAPPQQIRIMFNENILPQFSGVELKDHLGKVVATGKAATDPANKKLMIVPVPSTLAPGDYKVDWHAVSDDTHRVTGSYSFSVAP